MRTLTQPCRQRVSQLPLTMAVIGCLSLHSSHRLFDAVRILVFHFTNESVWALRLTQIVQTSGAGQLSVLQQDPSGAIVEKTRCVLLFKRRVEPNSSVLKDSSEWKGFEECVTLTRGLLTGWSGQTGCLGHAGARNTRTNSSLRVVTGRCTCGTLVWQTTPVARSVCSRGTPKRWCALIGIKRAGHRSSFLRHG